MHEIQVWALTGVVGVLVTLIGWAANSFINNVLKRMDVMISELRNLSLSDVQISNDVRRNRECIVEHKDKLADHDRRITHLERYPFTTSSTNSTHPNA